MNLDFTSLTPQQLVDVMRAAHAELHHRDEATAATVGSVLLDQADKSRIAQDAAERETAKLRALERERIARDAAEEVRRRHEAEVAESEQARREQKLREEMERAEQNQERGKAVIRQAAELCGTDPRRTYVAVWENGERQRVYIGIGGFHDGTTLVTYYASETDKKPLGSITTTEQLVSNKKALMSYCVDLAVRWKERRWDPNNYVWEE